jgi:transposase
MRRSEALQGVRMVRFQSVLRRYEANHVCRAEAAEMLGVSERTFRRWCRRFEDEGEAGLLDRRLGCPPSKRMPPNERCVIASRILGSLRFQRRVSYNKTGKS